MSSSYSTTGQVANDAKFKELILFICARSEGDAPFGAIKLNKLLFFCDFLAFRKFGKAITGQRYQKLKNGPAPRVLLPLIKQLQDEGAVAQASRDYHGHEQKRTLALREPKLNLFEATEIALITELIEEFWGENATQMSDLSHEFRGWQLTSEGEDIPYEVAAVEFEQQSSGSFQLSGELLAELTQLRQECG